MQAADWRCGMSSQVVDALIDQRLHGVRGANPGNTSSIVHDVMQQYSAFPFAEGTNPQARCVLLYTVPLAAVLCLALFSFAQIWHSMHNDCMTRQIM